MTDQEVEETIKAATWLREQQAKISVLEAQYGLLDEMDELIVSRNGSVSLSIKANSPVDGPLFNSVIDLLKANTVNNISRRRQEIREFRLRMDLA